MTCGITDEELWSGLDRHSPEVEAHLESCTYCRSRAATFELSIRAVTSSAAPVEPPLPARIGAYRILRRIGGGGMGLVYEAEQQTPRRRVALKVVRGGQYIDEYRVKLFQREAQTLGRLKHPSIAAIHEAGRTEDGQHFFVMELVQGLPLGEYVRAERLSLRQKLTLFGKICDAISYAHQRGVIHRDLKPTNIIVEPEGNPKILDFGLARMADPDAHGTNTGTEFGRIMGTLPYMSPEEARGNPDEIDIRCDVYSLGVILYELVTGELPYTVSRAALHEAVRVICETQPRRPHAVNRAVRGDLETIILTALEKQPSRRYQSTARLGEDVQRYLSNQPILARRAGAIYHGWKFIQRHRLVAAFVTTLLLIALVSSAWVDRAGVELQESAELNADLQDLLVAIPLHELAEYQHQERQWGKAEPNYRRALATFRRVRPDHAGYTGQALFGLAQLLIERGDNKDREEAEELLREAVRVFQTGGTTWESKHRSVLAALSRLSESDGEQSEAEPSSDE